MNDCLKTNSVSTTSHMPQSIFYDENILLKKDRIFQSIPNKKYVYRNDLQCTIEDFDDSSSNSNVDISNDTDEDLQIPQTFDLGQGQVVKIDFAKPKAIDPLNTTDLKTSCLCLID